MIRVTALSAAGQKPKYYRTFKGVKGLSPDPYKI